MPPRYIDRVTDDMIYRRRKRTVRILGAVCLPLILMPLAFAACNAGNEPPPVTISKLADAGTPPAIFTAVLYAFLMVRWWFQDQQAGRWG